jgi:hypothetical protein
LLDGRPAIKRIRSNKVNGRKNVRPECFVVASEESGREQWPPYMAIIGTRRGARTCLLQLSVQMCTNDRLRGCSTRRLTTRARNQTATWPRIKAGPICGCGRNRTTTSSYLVVSTCLIGRFGHCIPIGRWLASGPADGLAGPCRRCDKIKVAFLRPKPAKAHNQTRPNNNDGNNHDNHVEVQLCQQMMERWQLHLAGGWCCHYAATQGGCGT